MASANCFEGNDEQLIGLVRKHPELYNNHHNRYRDATYKKKVWNTIGAFMEEEGLACKNRWQEIREQHRMAVKKSDSSSETAVPKYKYSEQLGFLTDFIDDDDDQESQSSTVLSTSAAPFVEAHLPKEELIEPNPRTVNSITADPLKVPSGKKPLIWINRRVKRTARKQFPTEPTTAKAAESTELSPRVIELILQKLKAKKNSNAVDAFLAGIAPSLRNLSPRNWNLAKAELFQPSTSSSWKI